MKTPKASSSSNALFWDILRIGSQQGINFIISIILARLLLPEEFGLVGIGLAVINILRVVTDMGFAGGLIQNKDTDSITYSSVFYCNILLSVVAVLIIQACAPLIRLYNGSEDLVTILRITSLSLFFSSFNLVQRTILQKHLHFKKLAARNIVAQVVGGVLGVAAAFSGWGVYALVVQTLSASVISTLILWKSPGWHPRLEFSFSKVKPILRFSIFLFFDDLANAIFKRFDILFIGKIFSPASVGYYLRAESLNHLVTNNSSHSLTRVYFPVLSDLQDDPPAFNAIYFKLVSVISFLSIGLSGLLFLSGESLIILLFGEKWQPSVVLFQILAFKAIVNPLGSIMNYALLSKGKSKVIFFAGTLRKALKVIPYLIGFYSGLKAFAVSIVILGYIDLLISMLLIDRIIGIRIIYHLKKIGECVLPLIIFVAVKMLLFDGITSLLMPLAIAAAFGMVYLAYAYLLRIEGFLFLLAKLNGLKKKYLKPKEKND